MPMGTMKPACLFEVSRKSQIEQAVALIRKAAENMRKEAQSKEIDLDEQADTLIQLATLLSNDYGSQE